MKKICYYEKAQTAFTLIELLVVIAVIAVLASLLIPAISNSRERGKVVYCANNMSQLGKALVAYLDANRDTFPPATVNESESVWDLALLPYLGNATNVFACPSDPYLRTTPAGRSPRSYSANASADSSVQVPFGWYNGQGRLRMSDLDYHRGDIILLGEWPGNATDDQGLIGSFSCCALSLNDARAGVVHNKGTGGNYLMGSLGVRYIKKDDTTLAKLKEAGNLWTLWTQ